MSETPTRWGRFRCWLAGDCPERHLIGDGSWGARCTRCGRTGGYHGQWTSDGPVLPGFITLVIVTAALFMVGLVGLAIWGILRG